MIDILIGITIIFVMLSFFFLLVIYKLKKIINEFRDNNTNISHDLKTLLATFRLALDGLKVNKCLKIAIKNEGGGNRGGLFPLIEVFEGIGHGLAKSIKNNDIMNELCITQCKGELK